MGSQRNFSCLSLKPSFDLCDRISRIFQNGVYTQTACAHFRDAYYWNYKHCLQKVATGLLVRPAIFGGGNLFFSSIGYYDHSANNTQLEHKFNKPWFQTLLMFLGETLCLFGFLFVRFRKRRRLERESVYREIDESERSGIINTPYVVSIFIFIFRIFNWFFILPAFCDLLGTTIAGIYIENRFIDKL